MGAPVSGYYSRPAGAKPKSLPAYLSVHGAGVRSSTWAHTVTWAKEGFLALDINAHGIPNESRRRINTDLANGELKDYRTRGASRGDACTFWECFLRLVRAMDFLGAQPEWDGRTPGWCAAAPGRRTGDAAAGLTRASPFSPRVSGPVRFTRHCSGARVRLAQAGAVAARQTDAAILEVARIL